MINELTNDLSSRLRIKASMIVMGEGIAFGTEAAIMTEAANALEAITQKLKETDDALQSSADWSAQLKDDNDRLQHDIERAVETNADLLTENERLRSVAGSICVGGGKDWKLIDFWETPDGYATKVERQQHEVSEPAAL